MCLFSMCLLVFMHFDGKMCTFSHQNFRVFFISEVVHEGRDKKGKKVVRLTMSPKVGVPIFF